MAKGKPYEVGFCKPPKHTQFPKGTSGFKGYRHKPKETSVSEVLNRLLSEKITVTEGGREKRMTKQEIYLRQLVTRAMAGERQSSKVLFDYMMKRADHENAPGSSTEVDEFLVSELIGLLGNESGNGDG